MRDFFKEISTPLGLRGIPPRPHSSEGVGQHHHHQTNKQTEEQSLRKRRVFNFQLAPKRQKEADKEKDQTETVV